MPNDPDIPIPVAFSPPKIPVAEAGLLIDGQVDARETAATIIDLAVRGALTVQSYREDEFQVTLVDPNKATAPHEMVLLTSLFDGEPPGAARDLSEPRQLGGGARANARFRPQPGRLARLVPQSALGRSAGGFGFGIIAIAIFAAFAVGFWLLLMLDSRCCRSSSLSR